MRQLKSITARSRVRMVGCERVVIAGPITAAQLGVEVGSVVHVDEVRWYANPLRRLAWRIRHRGAGAVTPTTTPKR